MLTKINNFKVKNIYLESKKKKIKTNQKKDIFCIKSVKIVNKMLTLI